MNPASIIVILTAIQQLFDVIDRLQVAKAGNLPEGYLDARDAVRQALVDQANALSSAPSNDPSESGP